MRLHVGIAPLLLTKRFSFLIEKRRSRPKGACSPKKKTTMYLKALIKYIAMNEKYILVIEKVSQILFEAIITKEENLKDKIFEIDTGLLSLLRAIGWRVMSMLLTILISQVTTQAKKPGWKIQRRPQIKYTTIFGELEIESPYLCHKKLKKGIRPVAEGLGITAGKHSLGLTRAKRRLWG